MADDAQDPKQMVEHSAPQMERQVERIDRIQKRVEASEQRGLTLDPHRVIVPVASPPAEPAAPPRTPSPDAPAAASDSHNAAQPQSE